MTPWQRDGIAALLAFAFTPGAEFHHGDCVGADHEAAKIAKGLGYRIVGHPGPYGETCGLNDFTHDRKPYFERNRDIVLACGEVYAAPETWQEELRSGTWATVRYARNIGTFVQVVGPDKPAHWWTDEMRMTYGRTK